MSTTSAIGIGKRGRESPDLASAKKTRIENAPSQSQRDEEFWFEDGSIILVARDVEFRVYMRVLADHSTVFADMFSLPQPASVTSNPTCDIPTVHLEDSPEDLRHILRALLPRQGAIFVQGVEAQYPTFNELFAYARLGHKYQIDALLDQSLSYFKRCFSMDFDAWERYVPREWGDEAEAFAIGVVNIARLTRCDAILPAALAACSSLEGEQLVAGFEREDGTRERLSEDDLKLCITGKQRLALAMSGAVIKAFALYKISGCDSVGSCRRVVHWILEDHADDPGYFPMNLPFGDWDCYIQDCGGDERLCEYCLETLGDRFRAEQRTLWADLPDIFDISVEGWRKEKS
ncbi:hypothetical protein OH76DRAFT_1382842 [Lentinus brumalis]|uniref:BTB domain-containing protein n=1 Tax=Lentinus brumalis TaxID=2498619 RepID=A0A371D936_9APHY|nr:hypothetical protein OH76DRAFT_1382842 [Polyporus brumalis]